MHSPSLSSFTVPVATAEATKSFRTRSRRRRSLIPHAVANRRQVTMKLVVRQRSELTLGEHLRARVRRERVDGGILGPRSVGGAVDRTARREHEVADARCLRARRRELDGRSMIDVERDVLVAVADRIVRDRSEMHDRVDAAKALPRQVADVGDVLVVDRRARTPPAQPSCNRRRSRCRDRVSVAAGKTSRRWQATTGPT